MSGPLPVTVTNHDRITRADDRTIAPLVLRDTIPLMTNNRKQ